MRFDAFTSVSGIALLATQVVSQSNADPKEIDGAIAEFRSYIGGLVTQSAYVSANSQLLAVTDPVMSASLKAVGTSIADVIAHGQTLSADYLDGVPSTFRPLFTVEVSMAEAFNSIASKYSLDYEDIVSNAGGAKGPTFTRTSDTAANTAFPANPGSITPSTTSSQGAAPAQTASIVGAAAVVAGILGVMAIL